MSSISSNFEYHYSSGVIQNSVDDRFSALIEEANKELVLAPTSRKAARAAKAAIDSDSAIQTNRPQTRGKRKADDISKQLEETRGENDSLKIQNKKLQTENQGLEVSLQENKKTIRDLRRELAKTKEKVNSLQQEKARLSLP